MDGYLRCIFGIVLIILLWRFEYLFAPWAIEGLLFFLAPASLEDIWDMLDGVSCAERSFTICNYLLRGIMAKRKETHRNGFPFTSTTKPVHGGCP